MNEAGQDQPQTDPDLSTPNQDLTLDCQAHIHLDPRETGARPITVETQGKVVGRGKKPVPSPEVFKLAAIGCKDIEIADWFGIDSNTLRYNFSVELLKGRETLKQSLRRKQIEVAMGGNPTMLIFLGKNLLGQSDSPLQAQEAQVLPWEDQ
jgi:hypothetical protein